MGGRENHCRGEGLLWKVCRGVIRTCLLTLFISGALAQTLVKGRTMQSCWCCSHSHPLCILLERISFFWVVVSCCSQERSCTYLAFNWGGLVHSMMCHAVPAPGELVSIPGAASPRVLALLRVYFQNLVSSKWFVWQHLRLLEEAGKGAQERNIELGSSGVAGSRGPECGSSAASREGTSLGGFVPSLPLSALRNYLSLARLHPVYFCHCLQIRKRNAWSDRVETALNHDGEDWGGQKIYCPVCHSSVWLQT